MKTQYLIFQISVRMDLVELKSQLSRRGCIVSPQKAIQAWLNEGIQFSKKRSRNPVEVELVLPVGSTIKRYFQLEMAIKTNSIVFRFESVECMLEDGGG